MRRVWKGTVSGSSCKAEAHGGRAGAASPGVRALPHLNASHVQEGMPEVNGPCTPHHDFKLHEWKLDRSCMGSRALHQLHAKLQQAVMQGASCDTLDSLCNWCQTSAWPVCLLPEMGALQKKGCAVLCRAVLCCGSLSCCQQYQVVC